MKVPMKWLREYTHIALDAQDYAQKMVMSGTGVEGVEKTGADFSNVVVGRVVKMERHPNSDHLWICQVDAGEPLQIVTGAQNVHEGDYVPVAKDRAACSAPARNSMCPRACIRTAATREF